MWVKVLVAWALAGLALTAASREWGPSSFPSHRFYPASVDSLLQGEEEEDWRSKRTGSSLSVSNPIEVLRNRLLLEMTRRKMQKQGQQNREFLKNIGKRHVLPSNRLLDSFNQDQEQSADYLLSNSGEWETS